MRSQPTMMGGVAQDDAAIMYGVTNEADAVIVIDMLIAFSQGRKGDWCFIPPKASQNDPLGQVSWIGFMCEPDGKLAEESTDEVLKEFIKSIK